MSFSGIVFAITGAGSGIGLATAHLLASRGAFLSLADNRKEPLEAASASIREIHPSAQILTQVVDVTSKSDIDSWLDATITKFGHLDGAANLAGIVGESGSHSVQDMEDEEWDTIMNVNLKGVFNCLRSELQRMKGKGSVVNVSSTVGLRGYPMGAAYSASKHAVIGLTTSCAKEVAVRGIRINCIAPGPIDTPLVRGNALEPAAMQAASMNPMGRLGKPEEVAALIAWLAGGESSFITGGVHVIDGGLLC